MTTGRSRITDPGKPGVAQTLAEAERLQASNQKRLEHDNMPIRQAEAIVEDRGSEVSHPAATAKLKEYWAHGEGAAKIGWGTPGDFKRCETLLSKYLPVTMVAGYCSNLHQEATGARPGHAPGEQKH